MDRQQHTYRQEVGLYASVCMCMCMHVALTVFAPEPGMALTGRFATLISALCTVPACVNTHHTAYTHTYAHYMSYSAHLELTHCCLSLPLLRGGDGYAPCCLQNTHTHTHIHTPGDCLFALAAARRAPRAMLSNASSPSPAIQIQIQNTLLLSLTHTHIHL